MSIARDPRHDAPPSGLHPLLALLAPALPVDDARAAEAAARELLDEAHAALDAAQASVSPEIVVADPERVRIAAAALVSARGAAVVAYRALGTRPVFDVDAEDETCRALDSLEAAGAVTASRRSRSHRVLAVANGGSLALLAGAAFKVMVQVANPASTGVAQLVFTAGLLPVGACAASAFGVLRSARATRKLKPQLDTALRRSGCRSIRELEARRHELDEWTQRARLAAAEGDRCARAVNDWYEVAGVGADAAAVEALLEGAAWVRVADATWERARFTHRLAVAQLERALAEEPSPAPDDGRLADAVARMKRGRVIRFRR